MCTYSLIHPFYAASGGEFNPEGLNDNGYDSRTKTNIRYKTGLSHFLLGAFDKSVEYWREAKQQNPGIFDGRIFRIPSPGMEPQLIVGDQIVVDNEYYKHKKIQRWDVAVFLNPADSKNLLIKRVIGLPGDRIEIRKKAVLINNRKLFDKTANLGDQKHIPERDDFGPLVVPDGCYFVLGDNRDKSYDSRFIGPIPQDFFIGKALAIYGSLPNSYSTEGAIPGRTGLIIK